MHRQRTTTPPVDLEKYDDGQPRDYSKTLEMTRVDPFIWENIFPYLSDSELVTATQVCQGFRTIAENVYAKRHSRYTRTVLTFDQNSRSVWQPLIRYFGTVMSEVSFAVPPGEVVHQSDFAEFEERASEWLLEMDFRQFRIEQWHNVRIQRQFPLLEKISLADCILGMTDRCSLLTHFFCWYPNLKSLSLVKCNIGHNSFLEQAMPSLRNLTICSSTAPSDEFFLVFLVKNRQLKSLDIDFAYTDFADDMNMSLLPKINEISVNLEYLCWKTHDLSLPVFRQNFHNLKKLTLSVMGRYIPNFEYKNQLLPSIRFFPVLETLIVTLIPCNAMTNDDLIDLLTNSSDTLKSMTFVSRNADPRLTLGYDFHRRILKATKKRSEIRIEFEFGFGQFFDRARRKQISITKDWIKENGQITVVKDSLGDK